MKLLHFAIMQMTMYSSDKSANNVISRPGHDFAIISECFHENYMALNADKCRFLSVLMSHFQVFLSTILQLKM